MYELFSMYMCKKVQIYLFSSIICQYYSFTSYLIDFNATLGDWERNQKMFPNSR